MAQMEYKNITRTGKKYVQEFSEILDVAFSLVDITIKCGVASLEIIEWLLLIFLVFTFQFTIYYCGCAVVKQLNNYLAKLNYAKYLNKIDSRAG